MTIEKFTEICLSKQREGRREDVGRQWAVSVHPKTEEERNALLSEFNRVGVGHGGGVIEKLKSRDFNKFNYTLKLNSKGLWYGTRNAKDTKRTAYRMMDLGEFINRIIEVESDA